MDAESLAKKNNIRFTYFIGIHLLFKGKNKYIGIVYRSFTSRMSVRMIYIFVVFSHFKEHKMFTTKMIFVQ